MVLLNNSTSSVKVRIDASFPAPYNIYRTSSYEKCILANNALENNMIILPPLSITSIENSPVNHAPIVNMVNDLNILVNAGEQTITLTGIADGDVEEQDVVSVIATSSNTDIIPDPVVNYVQNASQATLTFTPAPDITGNVTITVVIKDNAGVADGGIDSTVITFKVNVNLASSITDLSAELKISPNPVTNVLRVTLPNNLQNASYVITDITGRTVLTEKVVNGSNSFTVNTKSLANGNYIIKIKDNNYFGNTMFIKK